MHQSIFSLMCNGFWGSQTLLSAEAQQTSKASSEASWQLRIAAATRSTQAPIQQGSSPLWRGFQRALATAARFRSHQQTRAGLAETQREQSVTHLITGGRGQAAIEQPHV